MEASHLAASQSGDTKVFWRVLLWLSLFILSCKVGVPDNDKGTLIIIAVIFLWLIKALIEEAEHYTLF